MKPSLYSIFAILLLCAMFGTSCKKTNPQLPANREDTEKKTGLDMARLNQELIIKEDELLKQYVAEADTAFRKTDTGFWYKIDKQTQKERLEIDTPCEISYKLYSLDGTLLEEVDDLAVIVGRKEVIAGLDMGLQQMRVGEKATFIFPWSLAYGLKGYNNLVPPYTSIMYEVEVME